MWPFSLALFIAMDRQPTELQPFKVSYHGISQLDELRQQLSTSLRPYSCQVYLFGSWATGTAHPSSDVDIAILPEAPFPIGLLSQIRFELEESSLLLTVDVIDLSQVTPTFRQRVLKEGELWIDSTND